MDGRRVRIAEDARAVSLHGVPLSLDVREGVCVLAAGEVQAVKLDDGREVLVRLVDLEEAP